MGRYACAFSLIVGTMNRAKELEICLDSLIRQTFSDFEVIVVDQSNDEETHNLVQNEKYSQLSIAYMRISKKGLSHARNIALQRSRGRYFALVDDDAAYSDNFLENAYEMLRSKDKIILSGRIHSYIDGSYNIRYDSLRAGKPLSIRKIINMAPSASLIVPIQLYEAGIVFDENFGVGAKFGACEETDYILQAFGCGYKIVYNPEMIVYHPTISSSSEAEHSATIQKTFSYSSGLGALVKKDKVVRKSYRLQYLVAKKTIKRILCRWNMYGFANENSIADCNGFFYGLRKYYCIKR